MSVHLCLCPLAEDSLIAISGAAEKLEQLQLFKKISSKPATKSAVLELLADTKKTVDSTEALIGSVRGFVKASNDV